MNELIYDASALLTLINREKGYEVAEENIGNSIMSSVNISESATILIKVGFSIDDAKDIIGSIIKTQISFDNNHAYIAANLYAKTKKYGLSFGDRACLSLAIDKSLPLLTADKIWAKLDIGIDIQLIR